MPSAPMNAAETFDIGQDDGGALANDYPAGARFRGKLSNIRFHTGD
jgi:hypothetical protein